MVPTPSYAQLWTLSLDEMVEWLDRRLANRSDDGWEWLIPRRELHDELAAVYRRLPTSEARSLFSDAVYFALDGTSASPGSEPRLFALLQLVALLKPIRAKPLLLRLLTSDVLWELSFAEQSLHFLALHTLCLYDIDDAVLSYVERSSYESSDFLYRLLCYRVSTYLNSSLAPRILDKALEIAPTQIDRRKLGTVVRSATERWGCQQLLTHIELTPSPRRESLLEFLRNDVVPWSQHATFGRELFILAVNVADLVRVDLKDVLTTLDPRFDLIGPGLAQATLRNVLTHAGYASRPLTGGLIVDPIELPNVFREAGTEVAFVTNDAVIPISRTGGVLRTLNELNFQELEN